MELHFIPNSTGNVLLLLVEIFFVAIHSSAAETSNLMWSWKCDSSEESCTRVSNLESPGDTLYPSVETCRLVCGKYGGLWPKPRFTAEIGDSLLKFSLRSLKFKFPTTDNDVKKFLEGASNFFIKTISHYNISSECSNLPNTVTISFEVSSSTIHLNWSTVESYNLQITTSENASNVKITSETVFGARHALETLSQLIEIYPNGKGNKCLVIVDGAKISDSPVYPHRGMLLDSARNFLSIDNIKKHIDAMAYSKLNVLHWHITDSQSFPLELPSLPNMTSYGAYSSDKIYHPSDVVELVSYARQRGVRIIVEIDAPSHSGNGWQWGPDAGLGNLVVCVNKQPFRSYCIQPPCGQLNPINPNLYKILKKLYRDLVNMLPTEEVFHMGGDEVFIPCWNSTPEIINHLGNKSRTEDTFLDLWSEYQNKALQTYDSVVGSSHSSIILWTSHLTQTDVIEKYLSKERYVIQTWVPASDPLPKNLLDLGYRIIVSTKDKWYLDHGFWGNTLYHNWRPVYNNRIPADRGTLGGEVCMWGEYVDDSSIEPKIWPRAAAAAERLWTNPRTTADQAKERFYRHRERLVTRGINAENVVPRWCYQNEGEC